MSDRTDAIMGLVALLGGEIGIRDKIEQEVAALETDLMQHATESERLRKERDQLVSMDNAAMDKMQAMIREQSERIVQVASYAELLRGIAVTVRPIIADSQTIHGGAAERLLLERIDAALAMQASTASAPPLSIAMRRALNSYALGDWDDGDAARDALADAGIEIQPRCVPEIDHDDDARRLAADLRRTDDVPPGTFQRLGAALQAASRTQSGQKPSPDVVWLTAENKSLRAALRFYAQGDHVAGFSTWEGPSGDDNWLCPPSPGDADYEAFIADLEQHMVEDGSIARSALTGNRMDVEPDEGDTDYRVPIAGEQPPRCVHQVGTASDDARDATRYRLIRKMHRDEVIGNLAEATSEADFDARADVALRTVAGQKS